jgi:hypothetical protein
MRNILILFSAIAALFSQRVMAQLPDVSTAADPVWYYIQVADNESEDRRGRVFTVLDNDSKVYGRSKTTSTDEAEIGKQLWRFEQSGSSGEYVIINKATGNKLDVSYYSAKSISVAALSENPTARWKFPVNGDGYGIQATATPAGGATDKVYVHQANDWDSRNYVFMLENTTYITRYTFVPFKEFRFEVSEGSSEHWYFITTGKTGYEGKCITAVANGAKLLLESAAAAGNERQQWKVVEKSSGESGRRFQLVNKATGGVISTATTVDGRFTCPSFAYDPSAGGGWMLTYLGSGQYEISDVRADSSAVYWCASLSSEEAAEDFYLEGYSVSSGFAWILEKADTYTPPVASAEAGLILSVVAPVTSESLVDVAPLWNPDRGLHLESIYQVDVPKDGARVIANPYGRGAGQGAVGDEVYPEGFMDTRNTDFQSWGDSVTLTQLYIYLTSFWDVDSISQVGLAHMQQLFNGLREHKVKAILRFAYSRDNGRIGNGHSGANPEYSKMMKHIEQLKPLVRNNFDVISFMEAGFMGTWGEWTPRYGTAENNSIVKALLEDMIPDGYGMVVRYTSIKNDLKSVVNNEDYNNRIGFANDYFTSGVKNCGSSDICLDSEEYWKVANGSFTVFMRGEVPYNEGPPWGFDVFMEVDRMLRYLKDHHYTTMDITQNFKDNITHWKSLAVHPSLLRKYNIFFDGAYFKDESGATVPRSFYQFVRDHLGYRLNLHPSSTLTVSNDTLLYDLKITNTGFATVLNPRPVFLTLIDEAGQVVKEERLAVNPREWQPWAKGDSITLLTHSISGALPLPEGATGRYRVGLWMPDTFASIRYDPAFCIKFATDNKLVTHWTDAANARTVNIVGTIGSENLPPTAITPIAAKKNIKVYARDGYLRVEGTDAIPTVYDLMGNVVSATSRLPVGIYFVKVDGVVVKMLVNN